MAQNMNLGFSFLLTESVSSVSCQSYFGYIYVHLAFNDRLADLLLFDSLPIFTQGFQKIRALVSLEIVLSISLLVIYGGYFARTTKNSELSC